MIKGIALGLVCPPDVSRVTPAFSSMMILLHGLVKRLEAVRLQALPHDLVQCVFQKYFLCGLMRYAAQAKLHCRGERTRTWSVLGGAGP